MIINKSYDLNDFLPHSQIISDLTDDLWNENYREELASYWAELAPYLKEAPSYDDSLPSNAIFKNEEEYILVPPNTPLIILMAIYVNDVAPISKKGDRYVAIVSIGNFTIEEDYTPKPQYCYATLYYNLDKTLFSIDYSFEESWLNLKFNCQ